MKSELQELQELVAQSEIVVEKLPPGPRYKLREPISLNFATEINGWSRKLVGTNLNPTPD
jgi:hypothetical protein